MNEHHGDAEAPDEFSLISVHELWRVLNARQDDAHQPNRRRPDAHGPLARVFLARTGLSRQRFPWRRRRRVARVRGLGRREGGDQDRGRQEGESEVEDGQEEERDGVAVLGREDDLAAAELSRQDEIRRVEPSEPTTTTTSSCSVQ